MRDTIQRRAEDSARGAAAFLIWLITSLFLVFAPAVLGAEAAPVLVPPEWLAERIDAIERGEPESSMRIIDYRSKLRYLSGHIPGAVHLPRRAAYDKVDGVEGQLPPIDVVVGYLERAGVANETPVVIYDGSDGLWAARLFWAMELLGHRDVRVLNGGIRRWKDAGLPTTRSIPNVPRAEFVPAPPGDRYVSTDWVLSSQGEGEITFLDTRDPREYTGEQELSRRGGHIPQAVNIDWVRNLTNGEGSEILPLDQLAEVYEDAGLDAADPILAYCQNGVRASHTYLVLRLLGYEDVRVYDDSWEVWGDRDDTPVEK